MSRDVRYGEIISDKSLRISLKNLSSTYTDSPISIALQ